jgi:hypothetical protein
VPFIDEATGDVVFRIVYGGMVLSGRGENIAYIARAMQQAAVQVDDDRGAWRALSFRPLTLPPIDGHRVRIDLKGIHGTIHFDKLERTFLQAADGIVRVVDSQVERFDANLWYLEWLDLQGFQAMPHVVQYNKRNLPNAVDLDYLNKYLNPTGLPNFESVATTGYGVFTTLKALVRLAFVRAKDVGGLAPT